jgi:hypothetical protein
MMGTQLDTAIGEHQATGVIVEGVVMTADAINQPPVPPVPVWKHGSFLMDGLCTKISPMVFGIVHISTIVPISGCAQRRNCTSVVIRFYTIANSISRVYPLQSEEVHHP